MQKRFRYRWLLIPLCGAVILLCLYFRVFRVKTPEPIYEKKYTVPEGSQVLIFPMDDGQITAGYLNPRYLEKNKYNHYGTDFTTSKGGVATVIASGTGTVLATETNENSLGNIVVIQYENVYNPTLGTSMTLIARCYHMISISVIPGQTVTPRQPIGKVDRQHKWYNHVHIELDTDIQYPYNTPQVAERSSQLLNRFPADGKSLLDPVSVLVCGRKQEISVNPNSDCCGPKEKASFWEQEFVFAGANSVHAAA